MMFIIFQTLKKIKKKNKLWNLGLAVKLQIWGRCDAKSLF